MTDQVQRAVYKLKSPTTLHIYHINKEVYNGFVELHMLVYLHAYSSSSLSSRDVSPTASTKEEHSHIIPRWIINSPANRPVDGSIDSDHVYLTYPVTQPHMKANRHAVLNSGNKWKTAMAIASRICECMSKKGTPDFLKMAEALTQFDAISTSGVVSTVRGPTRCGDVSSVEVSNEEVDIDTSVDPGNQRLWECEEWKFIRYRSSNDGMCVTISKRFGECTSW
ncbi:hypothetical protein P3T76_013362 [Phytophthora citrophthora]|uniref:Uncharacterized protein n=1 Tax=Phytophthora citrophthora TaxID=4793 RepID=A0AAD9G3D8_9STRA|nr:hypothetical protein P3T76_013362 [Phytophthora citrophthora]